MHTLVALIEQHGLPLAFALVLIGQLGVPMPSYPVIILAAAFAPVAGYAPWHVLAVAVAACIIADSAWFLAGRRLGRRGLRLLCGLSLSPDSCVRQTESIYARWGAPSLMVAKFIPGFAAVATSMAGILKTRHATFLGFDLVGATLWTGVAVLLGTWFRPAVHEVVETLDRAGRVGLLAVVAALALFVLVKLAQRRSLLRRLRMDRVTVDELRRLLEADPKPLVVDVRSASSRAEGAIPGSVWVDVQSAGPMMAALPRADEAIVYCACPNEASAAAVARQLQRAGFERVRPLHGGIDAWIASGLPVERVAATPGGGDPSSVPGARPRLA